MKNKEIRSKVYQRFKTEKSRLRAQKVATRRKVEASDPAAKQERLLQNVPRTIESTKEYQEDIVDVEGDDEVFRDEETDEFASFFAGTRPPKICVTTSMRPSADLHCFVREVASLFPTAEVRRRQTFKVAEIVKFCNSRDYSDVIIVHEDKKRQEGPNSMTIVHLPDGPTVYFKLSSIKLSKDLSGHARQSAHMPELILNNFNTRLGHTIGRFFASLVPPVPEFEGRQVLTVHNQRDFLFVRRHRYVFQNTEKVDLQEIGPRFTLKLRWLQRGTFDRKQGEYEWIYQPKLETSRRKFFL